MQILAIDKMSSNASQAEINNYFPEELIDTVKLYLEEKIRTFYFRKDRPVVIFIMEGESLESIKSDLKQLPLVKAGHLDFDLIPIGPLTPLKMLFPLN